MPEPGCNACKDYDEFARLNITLNNLKSSPDQGMDENYRQPWVVLVRHFLARKGIRIEHIANIVMIDEWCHSNNNVSRIQICFINSFWPAVSRHWSTRLVERSVMGG